MLLQTARFRSPARGSVLLLVLTTMGLIMAMTLTLYYQNQSSHMVQQNAETRLKAELAFRDSVGEKLQGKKVSELTGDLPEKNPGTAIHGKDEKALLEVVPVTTLQSKNGNSSLAFQHQIFQGFPYAAFAPNGSVNLESVASWTNPVAGTDQPLLQYSGRSSWLGAKENISVQESVSYAEFHALGSSTECRGSGNFAVFERSEYEDYDELLSSDIKSAYSALTARTINKTSLLVGKISLNQVTNLVSKGDYRGLQFLSLQQALEWPFFTFPTVKSKGKLLDINLHTPLLADGANFSSDVDLGGSAEQSPSRGMLEDLALLNDQIQFMEWVLRHDLREKPPKKPVFRKISWIPTPGDHLWFFEEGQDYRSIPADGMPSRNLQEGWKKVFETKPLPVSDGKRSTEDEDVDFDPSEDLENEGLPPPDDEDDFELEDSLAEEGSGEENIPEGGWYIIAHRLSKVQQKLALVNLEIEELEEAQKADPPALSEEEYEEKLEELQERREALGSQAKTAHDILNYWSFTEPKRPHQSPHVGFIRAVEYLQAMIKLYKVRHEMGMDLLLGSLEDISADQGSVEGPDRKKERELLSDGKLDNQRGYKGASYQRVVSLVWSTIRGVVVDALKSFPMKTIKIKLGFKTIKIKIPAFWKIPSWLKGIGKSIVNRLRRLIERQACLIHLGSGPMAKFQDSKNIQLSTFTVPRGRSHAIRRNQGGSKVNVTVVGDLWVQRGATLWIEGNLFVQSPSSNKAEWGSLGREVSNLLKPSGSIVLEEGATLLVDGNVTASRVVATAPPSKVHVITSGLLCEGDVTLNHGTRSALVLDDIAKASGLQNVEKALTIFLQDVAPNLSKLTLPKPEVKGRRLLTGPFHPRAAYFARYPVVLRVVLPAGPVYPTFERRGQNANNLLFRAFATFYAIHLNLTLGENFSPHSDWWIFGRGRVPVFPKILRDSQLKKAGDILSAIKDGLGDLAQANFLARLRSHADKAVKSFLSDFFPKTVPNVVVSLVKAAFSPVQAVPTNLPALALDKLGSGSASMGELEETGKKLAELFQGGGETNWAHHLLPECVGVFIYAEKNLRMGHDLDSDLASGFFVAGDDLIVDCHTTVGTLVSLNGSVTANRVLAYAPFSQASLYLPEKRSGATANPSGAVTLWKNAVSRYKYGHRGPKGDAVRIPSTPLYRTLWSGRNR